jgi:hypothetical protein
LISLGKWYDPISERWITPREPRRETSSSQMSANHVLEFERTVEIQRIWQALLDCCARD